MPGMPMEEALKAVPGWYFARCSAIVMGLQFVVSISVDPLKITPANSFHALQHKTYFYFEVINAYWYS
jgi:hypothetical protein